ncbi:ion transporter [Synechococcus sp. MIT S1220]|uniref:ion transporter n=1 Tax=Synechococcus sp. MIT S1220 TaxID=3082549 RepID=UPI0039AEEDF9
MVSKLRGKLLVLFGQDCIGGRSTPLAKGILVLIIFSILLAIVATEPTIRRDNVDLLRNLDYAIALLFLLEYLARLWIAPLRPGASRGIKGSLHFAATPTALLDLLAILPTILGTVSPELYLLRVIRLVRIGRIARSKRFRDSMMYFHHAIASKKEELGISAVYSAVVISVSSILMYLVEGNVQPEEFGSIPRCLWWSIITVTTVGYGDATPITTMGKIVASLAAISGIAVIAIPIGIVSAGFTDSINEEKRRRALHDQSDSH